MKKSKLVFFLFIISLITINAQTDSSSYTKQLQFHLSGGDIAFSYLKGISNSSAIRFRVNLGLNVSDGAHDNSNNFKYSSSETHTNKYSSENGRNSESVDAAVHYLFISKQDNDFLLFFGGGPFIGFSRDFSNTKNTTPQVSSSFYSSNYYNENSDNSLSLGLQMVIGLSYQVASRFSVLAEYIITGSYSFTKSSYSNDSKTYSLPDYKPIYDYRSGESTGHSWNASFNGFKIGLAFHF